MTNTVVSTATVTSTPPEIGLPYLRSTAMQKVNSEFEETLKVNPMIVVNLTININMKRNEQPVFWSLATLTRTHTHTHE